MQSSSLDRDISPPPSRRHLQHQDKSALVQHNTDHGPSLAAVEAGKAVVDDHLTYFSTHLEIAARKRLAEPTTPRLKIRQFRNLYQRNLHAQGRHFVVHQHDHPISGVHYDLRLQFSETSTISFAIPYGLPGNPNSIRPNRMAIETRVHNLWNNLIESASHTTGSMLIWDTGEYEILPYRESKVNVTDDEMTDDETLKQQAKTSNSQRLFAAFQNKHIRIRLHGWRLPTNYTISLRLPKSNDQGGFVQQPAKKRQRTSARKRSTKSAVESTDSENDPAEKQESYDAADASENDEDEAIRANNAYTGAINTIGSIHQRHWFLSLDRKRSLESAESESSTTRVTMPFLVLGRDAERSVITGRTADDVMVDEGVQRFVGRKRWRPITE